MSEPTFSGRDLDAGKFLFADELVDALDAYAQDGRHVLCREQRGDGYEIRFT